MGSKEGLSDVNASAMVDCRCGQQMVFGSLVVRLRMTPTEKSPMVPCVLAAVHSSGRRDQERERERKRSRETDDYEPVERLAQLA